MKAYAIEERRVVGSYLSGKRGVTDESAIRG